MKVGSSDHLFQTKASIANKDKERNTCGLTHFIFSAADMAEGTWYRLKDKLIKPTSLGMHIRQIAAKNHVYDSSKDQACLIKAFISKEHPQLLFFISKITQKMTDAELNEFVKQLFVQHGIKNGPLLIQRLKTLLTLEKMEAMVKTQFPDFSNTKNIVKGIKNKGKIERKNQKIESRRSLRRTVMIYLHKTIEFILNALIYITRLRQFIPGEQPDFYPDSYQQDLQYQALLNNLAVFSGWLIGLTAITGSILTGGALLLTGFSTLIGVAYVYNKYFRLAPDGPKDVRNLTTEAQEGNLAQAFGREDEIKSLVDALCSNSGSVRQHPILVGQTRVGKTEIVNGLAHYLNGDPKEKQLKNKKVIYINTSSITYVGTLDKILREVKDHESDFIFFFDEFQTIFTGNKTPVLVERFKSLLDPSKGGLPYCIFATTRNEFNEHFYQDGALLARLREMPIEPLGVEDIASVLRHEVDKEALDLIVEQEALEAAAKFHLNYAEYKGCSQPFTAKVILSQVLTEVRNNKPTKSQIALKEAKNERKELLAQDNNFQDSDFIFSPEGAARQRQIEIRNEKIHRLEKKIEQERKDIKRFQTTVKTSKEFKNKVEMTACKMAKEPSKKKLQKFLFNYYYQQHAYNLEIQKLKQTHPHSVVTKERIQAQIAKLIAAMPKVGAGA